jgi:ribonuclease BN (tRNA processing enzyme)
VQLEVVGFRVGVPMDGGCPCYAVRASSTLVLLDFGPGAFERVWARDMVRDLDAIVISHMHMDHVLDLLPLSGEIVGLALGDRLPERRRPALYVPREEGLRALDGLATAVGSSVERFGDSFDLREYDDSDRVQIGELELSFAPTIHPAACYAARVSDGDGSLVYGADGAFSDALVSFAERADVLLLEATYVEAGPEAERNGHMTGEQAALVARRAGAGRLLLTHFAAFGESAAENLRRARAGFAGEVELVQEGGVYPIAR